PPAAADVPGTPPAGTAAAAPSPGLPPPILFRCTTYDQGSYLAESADPQSRCVPLRTVGLDGNPTSAGAGQACQVVHDSCARVPDEQLCAAWKKRLGEAEVAWRFGRPQNAAANQAEFERVQRIVNDTTCAQAP
ncbi:MAG: DUF4124 domain-containing protein, partial [Pseudoxanthomonas sp.]